MPQKEWRPIIQKEDEAEHGSASAVEDVDDDEGKAAVVASSAVEDADDDDDEWTSDSEGDACQADDQRLIDDDAKVAKLPRNRRKVRAEKGDRVVVVVVVGVVDVFLLLVLLLFLWLLLSKLLLLVLWL